MQQKLYCDIIDRHKYRFIKLTSHFRNKCWRYVESYFTIVADCISLKRYFAEAGLGDSETKVDWIVHYCLLNCKLSSTGTKYKVHLCDC